MSKIKHSKFKNTGVLFELLVRQITNDAMNGVDDSPAINIVRESFKKDTMLKKELNFYQMLKSEKMTSEVKANKFVDIVLSEHKKLSKNSLKSEKYNLIKEIKKSYNLDRFFSTKISDYKLNASIYSLFESNFKESNSPIKILNSRNTLIEFVVANPKAKVDSDDLVMEKYRTEDKDVRLLSYTILLEKFNEKYDGLNLAQKNLLKAYINNASNTGNLKATVEEHAVKVSRSIKSKLKHVDDDVTKFKLNEVLSQLGKIKLQKVAKDSHVLSLMRAYSLNTELVNVLKK